MGAESHSETLKGSQPRNAFITRRKELCQKALARSHKQAPFCSPSIRSHDELLLGQFGNGVLSRWKQILKRKPAGLRKQSRLVSTLFRNVKRNKIFAKACQIKYRELSPDYLISDFPTTTNQHDEFTLD